MSTWVTAGVMGTCIALASSAPATARSESDEIAYPGYVVREVQRSRDRILRCFERALQTDPQSQGLLVVRFQVGPEGGVVDVRLDEVRSTFRDLLVRDCVMDVLGHLSLRAPPDRKAIDLEIPLRFVSAPR